jgi:hypothetical protein
MSGAERRGPVANAGFAAVAEIIAKGPPPEWLVPALKDYSRAIASGFQVTPALYREYKKRIARMQEAVDTLLKGLPKFYELPGEWAYDELMGEELWDLKTYFDGLSRIPKSGRRPHFGRALCADLVVSYYKRIHGKASPRSEKLYDACEQYWRACGGEPSGDTENWRRMVKEAADRDEPFLLHHMLVFLIGNGTELKPE